MAQHPGLANPDISKIIGEQWKAQPESVRNEWKALAEEEKLRHQQQYPDYRYQPRRGGRRGSVSSINISSNADKHHCNKCGGRSIATTSTTPFTTTTNNTGGSSLSTPMLPPPTPSSALTPTSRYLPPMMSNLAINTAQAQAQAQAARRTTRPTPGPLSGLHTARSRDDLADIQMLSPLSPDAKRRRFNQTYVPPSARGGGCSNSAVAPGTPYPFPADLRRQSLPRPDMLRGPSPRGGHPHSAASHHHHHHHHDGSLTLPPLQTPTTTASPHSASGASDPQSRSVEAMVMSMPFWGKIRVLGKIAPPYRPSAPPPKVRGAIVAVEGDDAGAVRAMASWLEERLNKTGETHARVADAPKGPPPPTPHAAGGEGGGKVKVGLGEYIGVIAEWHGRTVEMVEFITTPPSASSSAEEKEKGGHESDGSGSATPTPPKENKGDEEEAAEKEADGRTPVLIMPTYNLRAADAWASRIPITDNYSPADHWQWVATLWRGIVGPDITVYIKDVAASELELTGGRAVEVREDGQTKCLIVKRVNSKEIEESALRRLGFEVGELIRGVGGTGGK